MNRDDDFFKLPKARNPLRREPPAAAPVAPAPTAAAADAPIPPIVQATAPAASPAKRAATEPAHVTLPATPAAAAAVVASAPADSASGTGSDAASVGGAPRNPLRRDPPATPSATSVPPPTPPTQGTSRRWWLWPMAGAGVLGLIVIGGVIGYWAFMNVAARLYLSNQPLTIQLPKQADIVMRTNHNIDIQMKGVINAQVPLVQTLDLPVNGTYDTLINLDTKVPLETVITYEGVIPVDTFADIEAKAPVNFQNVKKYKNLHFKAKLPLKLRLPVKLVVPVKQDIPLKYKGPLRVKINHVIKAPVGTTLNTALKVDQAFGIPITSSLPLRMDLPQQPVHATITEADLFLNLATLRLEKKKDDAPPVAKAP